MTNLTATSLDQLTATVTNTGTKRAATKAIAEARFLEAFTQRVGEELVAASRRDILDAGSVEVARAMVEAAIRQADENLLAAIEAPAEVAAIQSAPVFAGPGLARLRSHPKAEEIRLATVADAEAARGGVNPFEKSKGRKAALALVEKAAPAPAPKPKKEAAAKPRKAEAAPRAKAAPEGKIVAVQANPKKAGSKSHARFALYSAGQSVADFVAACVAAGFPEREARADISWDRRKGFITIASA